MFKKLKMRILWTNLIILSVLIAVSFFTTYALSYQMIYRGIERDLNRIANMTGNHDANQGEQPPIMPNGGPQPDRMPIFGLETSKEGDILKVDAFFDAEIDFYREIISLIKITGSSDIGIHINVTMRPDRHSGVPRPCFGNAVVKQNVVTRGRRSARAQLHIRVRQGQSRVVGL